MKEDTIVLDYQPESFKQKLAHTVNRVPSLLRDYVSSMLPIAQWIHRYNLTWLVQDMIAGITVGIVIVPQSMAYAKIAGLAPQFGLYSSFAAVTLYCLFGTSKDISVGPISTVSLLVGTVVSTVAKIDPDIAPAEIATTLGLFTGIIMVVISLLRLGMLVDFIPEPAIAGYMTGSAITIVLSQCPKLFGITDVSTNRSPYLLFADILMKLPHTKLDVAFGLTSLVFLYAIRYLCGRWKLNSPKLQKAVFLFGIMRNGLIVIVGTFISFLICRGKSTSPISVIESVPAGFNAMGVPHLRWKVLQEAGGILPSIVLILILEHISVAKSFGRIYDYQINSDQEILAIGLCNVIAPFFGGFPSTGAFSRTAIMARSGARTPFAGVFSGAVVILALYALTPAFHFIPDAILAAVVIHAVSDLASSSHYLKELWYTSSTEFFVWVSAVIVTIFVNVQTGIYAAVGLSLVLMLYKFSRPPIKTLATISVSDEHEETEKGYNELLKEVDSSLYVDDSDPNFQKYITQAPTNILILRLCDSMLYPNAEYISDFIVHTVKHRTRCGDVDENNKKDSDRSWSYRAPAGLDNELHRLDVLKALVFDFSAVRQLDATACQILKTTRETIDKYAGRSVEWHFTNLQNHHVRSALLHTGFGTATSCTSSDSLCTSPENASIAESTMVHDLEAGSVTKEYIIHSNTKEKNTTPVDKHCCFHWDLCAAMKAIYSRWAQRDIKLCMTKIDTEMTVS